MKYFISVILLLFTVSSFAVQQQLIDAAENFDKAEQKLVTLEVDAKIGKNSIENWIKTRNENGQFFPLPESSKRFYQKKIDEQKNKLQDINNQIIETQTLLKKLEPLKQKYDTQVKKERDGEEFISSVLYGLGTVGLPLAVIVLFGVFIFKTNRKYKKMLEEGRISQQEYEKLTKCNAGFLRGHRINPATGLPIFGNGACDVAGNVRGSSSSRAYAYYRDYRERHRWDHHDDLQRRHRY